MTWAVPEYKRVRVDAAGEILIAPNVSQGEWNAASSVVNNWRWSHTYPLEAFHRVLAFKATTIDAKAIVARRLKRAPAIQEKLKRYPDMKLQCSVSVDADHYGERGMFSNSSKCVSALRRSQMVDLNELCDSTIM
jgi:hypothetical protein